MSSYSFGNSTWQWILPCLTVFAIGTELLTFVPFQRYVLSTKNTVLSEATTSLGSDIVVTYTIKGSFVGGNRRNISLYFRFASRLVNKYPGLAPPSLAKVLVEAA